MKAPGTIFNRWNVMMTFVLATFVHIRIISAVTYQILTNLFLHNFLQALFFGSKFFWTRILFNIVPQMTQIFGPYFLRTKFFFKQKNFWTQNLLGPNFSDLSPMIFWSLNFFRLEMFGTQNFLGLNFFFTQDFLELKFFLTQIFFQK